MRCYACDAMNANFYDGPTTRYYCTTCIQIILDSLTKPSEDDIIITDGEMNMEEMDDNFVGESDTSEVSEVWAR